MLNNVTVKTIDLLIHTERKILSALKQQHTMTLSITNVR